MNRILGHFSKMLNLGSPNSGISAKTVESINSSAASEVKLDDYYPLQAPRYGDLADGSIAVARQDFEMYVSQIDERIRKLKSFCGSNHVRFGKSDDALTSMCQFVFDEMYPSDDDPDDLAGIWIEYGLDVAALLGQAIIEKCPDAEWCLFDYHPDDHPKYLEIGLRNKENHQRYLCLLDGVILGLLQEFRNEVVDPEMRAEFFSGTVEYWSHELCAGQNSR